MNQRHEAERYLRDKANQYRRQAAAINHPGMARRLITMATQLEFTLAKIGVDRAPPGAGQQKLKQVQI
jgi:hypothetical protein